MVGPRVGLVRSAEMTLRTAAQHPGNPACVTCPWPCLPSTPPVSSTPRPRARVSSSCARSQQRRWGGVYFRDGGRRAPGLGVELTEIEQGG